MNRARSFRRRAGLLIPLFSIPSTSSWGIGDIGDLVPISVWLAAAGQSVLQLLPLNEMASGQQSPYSALSAMAVDPIYIRIADVPDFGAAQASGALPRDLESKLREVRAAGRIDYKNVRTLKTTALKAAFDRFWEDHWQANSERAAQLRSFVADQNWWINDYAIYRALHAREDNRPWTEWPDELQRRDEQALESVRRELARPIVFYQYLQWLAHGQWQSARSQAARHGVHLYGDLPFMVDGDSADVWTRQDQFRLDVSIGVPPDAFSASGQDWGMPLYDWAAMAADNFEWLRHRARRSADLFDGYRVDHLVGFYRTYGRPRSGGLPFFTPAREEDQAELGERVLGIFAGSGADIIAEDLGTVPDFVRASLERLGIPGYRVFRWERYWHREGQPFRDPADYPPVSAAASGTHDTEPQAVWWTQASDVERSAVAALPSVLRVTNGRALPASFDPIVRDALLAVLFASGSNLLLCPLPDVFGWRDRINEPATVADSNWTFRLPWPSDRLDDVEEARERRDRLRAWAEEYDRWSKSA
jgi:4-alpha-glucanotransferase